MSGYPGGEESDIESVTVQLANLDITITARPRQAARGVSGSSTSSPVVSVPAVTGTSQVPIDPGNFSRALEEQALAATGPAQCAALPLPFLEVYRNQLRAQHPIWTSAARVGRAFRAGVIANRRLAGEYLEHVSPDTPNRNTVYIVLRGHIGTRGENGFWTSDYRVYSREVHGAEGFHSRSISHAFATRAEVSCYLAGARRGWPVEL